jgi:hypothetical protein
MRAKHWVGLDVGESCTRVCVLRKRGPAVLECSTGSSAEDISRGLSMFDIADIESIVMESGAPGEIERQLKKMGYPVVILDVRKTHRYLSIRHNKTDENDARGLAEIARLGELSRLSVYSKSYDSEVLRNQLCVRKRLVDTRAEIHASMTNSLASPGSILLCSGSFRFQASVRCARSRSTPQSTTRTGSLAPQMWEHIWAWFLGCSSQEQVSIELGSRGQEMRWREAILFSQPGSR